MTTTLSSEVCIDPDWPVPAGVRCLVTGRDGGTSQGVYLSLNLGAHVGDDPDAVERNRAIVTASISGRPVWLNQIHGTRVVDAADFVGIEQPPQADAAITRKAGVACTVMTADCLPVLFCDDAGTVVAAAHAGWRGLHAGVLEATVAAMSIPTKSIMTWFGPAIGPQAFEVGDEVRAAFVADDPQAEKAFVSVVPGKWLADIYLLARQRLERQGVSRIYGGQLCTVADSKKFFSYRRDGQTGRMASMIWLDPVNNPV